MAASYGHSVGRASVGGGGSWLEQQLLLPSGACGYRDLNGGAAAPTCGCRRFWLSSLTAPGVQRGSERAWCFCGHHACFHENAVNPPVPNTLNVETGHSNVPATLQNPAGGYLSTQQCGAAPTWSQLIGDNTRLDTNAAGQSGSAAGLGIRNDSQVPSQSINTRLWHALNGFARQQDNGGNSGDTSKLPSTAVPSVIDEPITPARALPDHSQERNIMGPPSNVLPGLNEMRADQYSATEVATPSVRGTPEFNVFGVPGIQAITTTVDAREERSPRNAAQHAMLRHAQSSHSSQPRQRPSTAGPSLSIQEMCNTIQNYGRRIDLLETMSFTHLPSDEVIDRFDMVDGRLLDIEQWRTDQDRAQEADDVDERLDSVKTRLNELEHWRETNPERPAAQASSSMRHLLPETSSFASDGSFDSEAAAQTEAIVLATLAANAETRPRIDALESRIVDLENATLPSFARPWTVQVVLLPFGRGLPGIWFSSSDSTQHSQRTQASEEWSGPIASKFTGQSSFSSDTNTGAWTTQSIEAWARRTEDEWLSAKACGPSGTVFKRLESRGLVRDVILTSPDARHICGEVANAFGNVLGEPAAGDGMEKFQGLQERFIPLRKVRKSSRLRFLGTAEMISPALWNASLLESVFMKVNDGERRLYMTTPEAYTQSLQPGWTWQSLKSLPMYGADGELQAAQVVGNVVEKCWTYNDRLDHASSLNSSFASQESLWGMSSENPGNGNGGRKETASNPGSPQATARSLSLPNSTSAHVMEIDAVPKRRVASFEIEATLAGAEHSHGYAAKRRRVSSSPELERRGVNFTPRWSREPPSPFPSDDIGIARSQAASTRARGTTPFAYATPHSNLDYIGDDGGTEVDTEPRPAQSEYGSEEWEGMQDAQDGDPTRSEYQEDENFIGNDMLDEDELSVFEDDEL